MRLLSTVFICFCFLACSRSNEAKQESRTANSASVSSASLESTRYPLVQGPATLKRGGIFEVGQRVDFRKVGLHDTILVKFIERDSSIHRSKEIFIPLTRSFRTAGYQIDANSKDSVWVITEELNALRKGEGAEKSEGGLFLVRRGVVVKADMRDIWVELDSTMAYEVHRWVHMLPAGSSKSMLVVAEVSYPCYPEQTSFTAYGINSNGVFVESPGLYIDDDRELPDSIYDGQILIANRMFGCIGYEVQIRFDLRSYSFITLPQGLGYEANGEVSQDMFETNGDTIHMGVHQEPSAESKAEEVTLTKGDTLSVNKLVDRNDKVWVRVSKNRKEMGWIDNREINKLGLTGCD